MARQERSLQFDLLKGPEAVFVISGFLAFQHRRGLAGRALRLMPGPRQSRSLPCWA